MNEVIRISELFRSVQGETTYAGLPCTFVRLAGCNLRCSYCDTRYAAEEPGRQMELKEVAGWVHRQGTSLVCVTGGEPLLQERTPRLVELLLKAGHRVLVETNGTLDISRLPPGAIRVMDVKCPGSGECGRTHSANIEALRVEDELKFVLCDRPDFEWAAQFVRERALTQCCQVLFAPAHGQLSATELAGWILESGLEVRLQVQLHRILWPNRTRGA